MSFYRRWLYIILIDLDLNLFEKDYIDLDLFDLINLSFLSKHNAAVKLISYPALLQLEYDPRGT